MPNTDKPLIVKPAGFSNAIIAILLFLSVTCNIYLAFRSADIMKELASREMAQQVITNNYYSFLQFVKKEFQYVKSSGENQGFLTRLFNPQRPAPDLTKWEDPLDERPVEDR